MTFWECGVFIPNRKLYKFNQQQKKTNKNQTEKPLRDGSSSFVQGGFYRSQL